jgi:hypothetical protein
MLKTGVPFSPWLVAQPIKAESGRTPQVQPNRVQGIPSWLAIVRSQAEW